MDALSPSIDDVPNACLPLKIVVSEAGQIAALKALVSQCVPILRDPDHFALERRRELAMRLARAICPPKDAAATQSFDSEGKPSIEDNPGSWLEDDQ